MAPMQRTPTTNRNYYEEELYGNVDKFFVYKLKSNT